MTPAESGGSPTVLISWAHGRGDQGAAWQEQTLQLANALRESGIDADIDLYHNSDLDIDWHTFGPLAIERTDFTLVAFNGDWKERWEGTNEPSVGAGAAREAQTLKSIFDNDQVLFRRKVKLVQLAGADKQDIPHQLHGVPRFVLEGFTSRDLEPLLRTLLGRPEYIPPRLGSPPPLAPRVVGSRPFDREREHSNSLLLTNIILIADGEIAGAVKEQAELWRDEIARQLSGRIDQIVLTFLSVEDEDSPADRQLSVPDSPGAVAVVHVCGAEAKSSVEETVTACVAQVKPLLIVEVVSAGSPSALSGSGRPDQHLRIELGEHWRGLWSALYIAMLHVQLSSSSEESTSV